MTNEHGCEMSDQGCHSHKPSEHCPTECTPECGHYTERALAALRKGELPPVIATVKAGDGLILLAPSMQGWTPEDSRRWQRATSERHPGITVTFVPAVGVVHVEEPEGPWLNVEPRPNDVVIPLCGHTYSPPDMKGWWSCCLAPDHEEDHFNGSAQHPLRWPKEPWGS